MAEIKIVFVLIIVAALNLVMAGKEREEGGKGEAQNSNEYELKTIFNYLQTPDSKEKKTSDNENEEHPIKIKEKENSEHKIKIREHRNHHKEEKNNSGHSKTSNLRHHRERGFTKITPTVGVYATPKITSIKKWKNKNKENKYQHSADDEDISKSYPEEDKAESKTTKPRDRRRKGKGKKNRLNKDKRSIERRNSNNFNNDLVISKEINMTKSFNSDQPVDIIVHIKMKN